MACKKCAKVDTERFLVSTPVVLADGDFKSGGRYGQVWTAPTLKVTTGPLPQKKKNPIVEILPCNTCYVNCHYFFCKNSGIFKDFSSTELLISGV